MTSFLFFFGTITFSPLQICRRIKRVLLVNCKIVSSIRQLIFYKFRSKKYILFIFKNKFSGKKMKLFRFFFRIFFELLPKFSDLLNSDNYIGKITSNSIRIYPVFFLSKNDFKLIKNIYPMKPSAYEISVKREITENQRNATHFSSYSYSVMNKDIGATKHWCRIIWLPNFLNNKSINGLNNANFSSEIIRCL